MPSYAEADDIHHPILEADDPMIEKTQPSAEGEGSSSSEDSDEGEETGSDSSEAEEEEQKKGWFDLLKCWKRSQGGKKLPKLVPPVIKPVEEVGITEAPNWDINMTEQERNDHGKSVLRRLLHWGPLIALAIVSYIGLTTVWLHTMWWPIDTIGGFIHMSIFLFWNYSTVSSLCLASKYGGGYVPKKWSPKDKTMCDRLQFCEVCEGYKPPRSHHCSNCKRCVMKMDHHCPWVNNCVGHRNHAYFVRFLASAIIGCAHACVIIGWCVYHALQLPWYAKYGDGSEPHVYLTITSFIVSVGAFTFGTGVSLALCLLLYYQLVYIKKNMNYIEDYIVSKAEHRMFDERYKGVNFIYPYDLGWRENLKQVFSAWSGRTVGNGVWYPVRADCDQFTLSEEQIRQKKLKNMHARVVEIVKPFNGGYFGAVRHGCRIFFGQPISDEPRVKVEVGEKWIVTRGNKRWIYGHKKGAPKRSTKGWFPRSFVKLLNENPHEE